MMSKVNTGYLNTVPSNENISKVDVHLSDLLTESLRKINKEIKDFDCSIRCESLPTIKGNKAKLSRLFDLLIAAIFASPPRGSKLFLYVDCIQERDARVKKGIKYLIKFLTNVTIGKNWKELNADLLMESNQIILAHNGVFSINTVDNSGCLFTISFPGKGN
jgi:hypothetical protein